VALVGLARGQELADSSCGYRRHAREANAERSARCALRHNLARGRDDLPDAGQLELQPDEPGRGARATDGVNPHAGSADVRGTTQVGVAAHEPVHEHVDFAPGISAAFLGARLLSRITRRCMHTPTCRISACACQISVQTADAMFGQPYLVSLTSLASDVDNSPGVREPGAVLWEAIACLFTPKRGIKCTV